MIALIQKAPREREKKKKHLEGNFSAIVQNYKLTKCSEKES